jgi:SulP family sulfate permease
VASVRAGSSDPGFGSEPRRGLGTRPTLLLSGLLPIVPARVPADVLAGVTLAALGIPEVLGYASIARMPVVTGLYTMLLPMVAFALLGSSRHLVVSADSATAAIAAAGIAGMAAVGSPRYVAVMGLAALVTGGLLMLARLARLVFLANFLSRTVLIGFLTGVGISVAIGQLPDLLGVSARGSQALSKLASTLREVPHASGATMAVAAVVLVVVPMVRRVTRRVPAALLVVVGAIGASIGWDLPAHGVRVLGAVPAGLPPVSLPALGLADVGRVATMALSMALVVLAQSSATSRAYAARYDEPLDDGADLVGLAAANAAAAVTGTFVVNGSPTKTQMVDSAGGRSQLAHLTCSLVVLIVLLFATGPLAHLPIAVLAAVVFLIGFELVDVAGLRRILALRREEFVVAVATAVAVVGVGVEAGIGLAIVASVIDHLRHSYDPATVVLARGPDGHWHSAPATPDQRTADGLVIYRFPSGMYYANAHKIAQDLAGFVDSTVPLALFCLDGAGIADVDYTAAEVLRQQLRRLTERGVRVCASSLTHPVHRQLIRYRLLPADGSDVYPTPGAVLEMHRDRQRRAD